MGGPATVAMPEVAQHLGRRMARRPGREPALGAFRLGYRPGKWGDELRYRAEAAVIVDDALAALGGAAASDEAGDLASFASYKLSADYPGPVNRQLLPRLLVAAFRAAAAGRATAS